jgi:two-component sensor histidine kinase
LILNEALTNAIKHAFPEKNKGNTVVIEMVVGERGIVHLKIADNGIGLPPQWDRNTLKSLGIKLMQGLTDDLGGRFSIESHNGTIVYIRFVANAPFEHAIKIIESNESILHA